MTANDKATGERLRRLERLVLLHFIETHGGRPELSGAAIGGVRAMRERCARDAAAILREHAVPPIERRPAA